MKKVLFAINQNSNQDVEKKISTLYEDTFGENVEFESEYYLAGIEKSLLEDKFDVLVLREDLESTNLVSIEFLDKLTDRYPNLNIIFMIKKDSHSDDDYIYKILALNIYNIVYINSFSVKDLICLFNKPRTKYEAKLYLEIDDTSIDYTKVSEVVNKKIEVVNESEIETILQNLNNVDDDNLDKTFNEIIIKNYEEKERLFIISCFNESLVNRLMKNSRSFKKVKNKLDSVSKDIENNIKVIEVEVEKEKIVEVEKEKIIEKEKIVKEYINEKPSDYKKTVVFIGVANTGKTSISYIVGNVLSKSNKVALLDLNNHLKVYLNPEMNQNNFIINNNFTVYFDNDGNFADSIDIAKTQNDVVIININNTDIDSIAKYVDQILIFTDIDYSHLDEVAGILKSLKDKKVSLEKVSIIYNKVLLDKYIKDFNKLCGFRFNGDEIEEIGHVNKYIKISMIQDLKALEHMYELDFKVMENEPFRTQINELAEYIYKNKTSKKTKSFFNKIFGRK